MGLCVKMLYQFKNKNQLKAIVKRKGNIIFAPVNPELHLGSVRSFIFEMMGHGYMNLAEGR